MARKTYRVRWEIDLDADSPTAAALEAYDTMQDSSSLATWFEVTDEAGNSCMVDVLEVKNEPNERSH